MPVKYIFITGGVVSGLGKGITASSIGRLLKARGLKVTIQKFDPYINVDPGTMSPYQHGEVFVTDDGAETDLDLGHYERFIDENLNQDSNITTGKVYWNVINRERNGDYLGGTVQVIPHITNEIKEKIYKVGQKTETDIVITEIGGTVGDIEGLPFFEAIRQVSSDVGRENVIYIHVTLVPYLSTSHEIKTKPTQHSVKELRSIGIQPDIIVCRTDMPLSKHIKDKIGLFCNLDGKYIIENANAEVLYEVPLLLEKEGLAKKICEKLQLECGEPDLTEWRNIVEQHKNLKENVKIAIVGKYIQLHDAYISVVEALRHGGIVSEVGIDIEWINAENINGDNVADILKNMDGVLVPGGFGNRGVDGKIQAIRYARENMIPFFGVSLGMQLAAIEFAQNVLNITDANSREFNPQTSNAVIDSIPKDMSSESRGSAIRLGSYSCILTENSLAFRAYGSKHISERHRHMYGFNNSYRDALASKGLIQSGFSVEGDLVEIIELEGHPWFVGVQYQPEFKSRPNKPHPLYVDFVNAAKKQKQHRNN